MKLRWLTIFAAATLLAGASSSIDAGEKRPSPKVAPSLPGRLRLITLEEAYDLALASDQAIRNAWLELCSARLEPWSALTRLGPRLTGNLSYELIRERRFTSGPVSPVLDETLAAPDLVPTYTGTVAPGQLTPPGVSGPTADPALGAVGASVPIGATDFHGTHSYTRRAGVTLQQPLIDLTVFPAWRFGRLTAESAQLRRLYTIRETLFGVAQAYYAVLKLQAIVAVNRETVALATDQVTVARGRFTLGDVAESDVLRAESIVQAGRRRLIESEGLLDVHRNTLANILNLDWGAGFTVADPKDSPPTRASFSEVLMTGFERREDFRASALGIGMRIEHRKEVVASYAPRVVAQANHDWTDVTTNSSNTTGQGIWSGVVAVQVPIFEGGQREIDLKRTDYAIEHARIDHEQLTKSIEAEVQRAWVDVRTLQGSVVALEAEASAVQRAYQDLATNYAAGTATSIDLSASLLERNNARSNLAGARYDLQVALRNLQRAEAVFQDDRVKKARVK